MKTNLKYILFFLTLILCSRNADAAGDRYVNLFNSEVAAGRSTIAVSSQEFDRLFKYVLLSAKDLGYKTSVYHRPNEGFFVLVKAPQIATSLLSGNAVGRLLIMKFTKDEGNKIRVDLVNGGTDMIAKGEVQKDIEVLAGKINKSDQPLEKSK